MSNKAKVKHTSGLSVGEARFRLMNSAVMPYPGRYEVTRTTPEEFGRLVRSAHQSGRLASTIGYQATADLIEVLSGVRVRPNREMTTLEDGDVLLICKLNYRLRDVRKKRTYIAPRSGDYDYFLGVFRGNLGASKTANENRPAWAKLLLAQLVNPRCPTTRDVA